MGQSTRRAWPCALGCWNLALAVTALKFSGFPSTHLSLPENSPKASTEVAMSESAQPPGDFHSQAQQLDHPKASGWAGGRPCYWSLTSVTAPSGHQCVFCWLHSGLLPRLRPCVLLTRLWNLPRAQLQVFSEVTQLLNLPSGSRASGPPHRAAISKMNTPWGPCMPQSCDSQLPGGCEQGASPPWASLSPPE